MVGVHLAVQYIYARHAAHGSDNGVNLRRVAAFAKIGHALNQSLHGFGFLFWWLAQLCGSFGFRSGNVGRSYTNALFPDSPGAPRTWPAGPGACAGFSD